MKKLYATLSISLATVLLVATSGAAHAVPSTTAQVMMPKSHVATRLQMVNNSGVEGFVNLRQLKGGGTHISLIAFGLQAGHDYVSLYYDNHKCALEPYSADDVVGGIYTANIVGIGLTHGNADDDLDEINSVSVRDANTFTLLACADVHP